jgi:hypothetical protein
MHQEIVEKAKAAQKETNPGAQHKALLDWGEALLNLCGFSFRRVQTLPADNRTS